MFKEFAYCVIVFFLTFATHIIDFTGCLDNARVKAAACCKDLKYESYGEVAILEGLRLCGWKDGWAHGRLKPMGSGTFSTYENLSQAVFLGSAALLVGHLTPLLGR